MGMSCQRMSVDRNTIALTAIIAEIMIAAPDNLPPYEEGEKLSDFCKKCKAVLDRNPDVHEKIKSMKKKSELLPTAYKFSK